MDKEGYQQGYDEGYEDGYDEAEQDFLKKNTILTLTLNENLTLKKHFSNMFNAYSYLHRSDRVTLENIRDKILDL